VRCCNEGREGLEEPIPVHGGQPLHDLGGLGGDARCVAARAQRGRERAQVEAGRELAAELALGAALDLRAGDRAELRHQTVPVGLRAHAALRLHPQRVLAREPAFALERALDADLETEDGIRRLGRMRRVELRVDLLEQLDDPPVALRGTEQADEEQRGERGDEGTRDGARECPAAGRSREHGGHLLGALCGAVRRAPDRNRAVRTIVSPRAG
jgi:hypothetical protein